MKHSYSNFKRYRSLENRKLFEASFIDGLVIDEIVILLVHQ